MLKIREIRNKKNLTIEQLALQTDISSAMIRAYEKETKDIPLKKLFKIAEVLNVAIYELIDIEVHKMEQNTNIETIKGKGNIVATGGGDATQNQNNETEKEKRELALEVEYLKKLLDEKDKALKDKDEMIGLLKQFNQPK